MTSLSLKQADGSETTHELDRDLMTVGREPHSKILLDDSTTSIYHAEIRHAGGVYILRDAGSSNGTFVNGNRVTECELHDGDIVNFAGQEAVFHSDEAPKPAALPHEKFAHAFALKLKHLGIFHRENKEPEPEPTPEPQQPMFVHTALFWLKSTLTDDQIELFEERLAALTKIETVHAAYFGKPAETDRPVIDRSYSYALTLIFEDRAKQDAYQLDPIHIKFLMDCDRMWSRLTVYDVQGIAPRAVECEAVEE